jgi:hypothetical protein
MYRERVWVMPFFLVLQLINLARSSRLHQLACRGKEARLGIVDLQASLYMYDGMFSSIVYISYT